jgi:hypothetical protein
VFNFVFDRRNDSRPYPNLAPMMSNSHDSYHGMGDTFPWIVPCRLLYFCKDHQYPVNVSYIDQDIPSQALYPVGIGWFDYNIDYFSMMSDQVKQLLKQGSMRVLFYYHEGDNPFKEKARLDQLCLQHNLSQDSYRFISGNTCAKNINGFVYFPDHELFYWRNSVKWNDRSMPGCSYHDRIRGHRYTALNRLHKWWRSTIMSDLKRHQVLDQSFWSYNNINMGDLIQDNPIQIDCLPGLRPSQEEFLKYAPYQCDQLTEQQHNSHWTLVPEHYDDSYCNLILETLYDAEQSNGTFLTEKTFKPIRHAQPFMIFGTPNSLDTLRSLGYKTFDHALDNSYDKELDNTQRYIKAKQSLLELNKKDLHKWYMSCRDDIIHNQQLFLSSKYNRLNILEQDLKK